MWHVAVLWGLDGALLDNDDALFDRLRLAAGLHGADVSRDEYFGQDQTFNMPDGLGAWQPVTLRLHGASDKALFYWLAARKPAFAAKADAVAWTAEMQSLYLRCAQHVASRPQVAGLVRALGCQGVPQGLVTNAAPARVATELRRPGAPAADHFAFVEYGDQYVLPKPYAAVYQAAAARARLILRERHGAACRPLVLCVENTLDGVRSAHAAGLPVVQYLKPGQAPFAPAPGAPQLRAVRDMRGLAEVLVTMSGA